MQELRYQDRRSQLANTMSNLNATLCRPENFKSICTNDSIHQTIQNGEYINTKPWTTSTLQAFQKVPKDFQRVNAVEQFRDKTNFVFGYDKARYLTTTKDFKWNTEGVTSNSRKEKLSPPSAQVTMDTSTNIVDLSSKFSENNSIGSSEYQTTYSPIESHLRPILPTLAERKKKTNDLRSTHFQLGDSNVRSTTETQHSYVAPTEVPTTKLNNIQEPYSSSVFRKGDWGGTEHREPPSTVTQLDFQCRNAELNNARRCPLLSNVKTSKTYGSIGKENFAAFSSYSKDFLEHHPSCYNKYLQKPPFKTPLAEIFPKDTKMSHTSVAHAHFTDKTSNNKHSDERKKENCLVVNDRKSLTADLLCCKPKRFTDKHLSMSETSYYPKFIEVAKPIKNTYEQYNHLMTDPNRKTALSECHGSYVQHKYNAQEIRNECLQRRKDNKATHFEFTSRKIGDSLLSEQSSQFRNKSFSSQCDIPAAGKLIPHVKKFNHIFSCGNGMPRKCFPCSEMKSKYLTWNSDSGNWTREGCWDSKSLPSHFFHLDNEYLHSMKTSNQTHFPGQVSLAQRNTC